MASGLLHRVGDLLADTEADRLAGEKVGLNAPVCAMPNVLDEIQNRNSALEDAELIQSLPIATSDKQGIWIKPIQRLDDAVLATAARGCSYPKTS